MEVKLTKDFVCSIDDIDADLAIFHWFAKSRAKPYAARWVSFDGWKHKKEIYMHRVVLERKVGRLLEEGEYCDHINGDKTNNRRSNLRLASLSENSRNRGKNANNTSGYKGVSWHSRNQKWVVSIGVNGTLMHIGYFDDLLDAYSCCSKIAW